MRFVLPSMPKADECRRFLIVEALIGSWFLRCVVSGAVDELHVAMDADVDEC